MASSRTKKADWKGPLRAASILLLASLCVACNDPAKRQAQAEARARAEQAREAERLAQEATEAAAARRLADEKAARERAAAQAKHADNALGACCQALGRRGFEERSMPDMAAKQACLDLEQKQGSLAEAQSALTSALGERELPPACMTP
jgi:hypothetical protein